MALHPKGYPIVASSSLSTVVSCTPYTSNGVAYAPGDVIGIREPLTGAVSDPGSSSLLNTVTIIDKSNQSAPLEILIFDSIPTAATVTNNSAFAFSTTTSKLLAKVAIAATDYVVIDSIAVATVSGLSLGPIKAAPGSELYAVFVTTGSPNYADAGNAALIAKFSFIRD